MCYTEQGFTRPSKSTIQQIFTLKIVIKSAVSVNESQARLVHESTALPQENCILFHNAHFY